MLNNNNQYLSIMEMKMKNVILMSAIAMLLSAPAIADDDEHNTTPTPVVSTPQPTTVTSTNALTNQNVSNNNNAQGQEQVQSQWQDQNQQQEASSHSTSQGGSAVAHGGAATATGNGSGNSTTINQSYSDIYRERLNPVSTAVGSNLTSGADTCLGSITGGVQTQILGVSGGKTVVDENCVLIKNTKLLLTMGLPSAACFYVRQDPKIDQAMAAAGVECREPPPVNTEDVPVPYDPAKTYK